MQQKEINKIKKEIQIASLNDFLQQAYQISVSLTGEYPTDKIYESLFATILKAEKRLHRLEKNL